MLIFKRWTLASFYLRKEAKVSNLVFHGKIIKLFNLTLRCQLGRELYNWPVKGRKWCKFFKKLIVVSLYFNSNNLKCKHIKPGQVCRLWFIFHFYLIILIINKIDGAASLPKMNWWSCISLPNMNWWSCFSLPWIDGVESDFYFTWL